MVFADWDSSVVMISGQMANWAAATDHCHLCRHCGSTPFATTDGKTGIRLGTFDEPPSGLTPEYELFTLRCKARLPLVPGAAQHPRHWS